MKNFLSGLLILFIICLSANGAIGQEYNWEYEKTSEGIVVWTRTIEDNNFKAYKLEATLDASLKSTLALLSDLEKMTEWYDRVSKLKIIDQINPKEAKYYLEIGLPWPVKDRYAIAQCKFDIIHDKKAILEVWLVDEDIKKETSKVKMSQLSSRWILEEKTEGITSIIQTGHMDPAGSLPAWLTNRGITESPIKSIKAMRKRVKDYREASTLLLN